MVDAADPVARGRSWSAPLGAEVTHEAAGEVDVALGDGLDPVFVLTPP